MRRSLVALFRSVSLGQSYLRSRSKFSSPPIDLISVADYYPSDYRSLYGKRICHKKLTLADRVFGHYGGRHYHFHTVPYLRATSS
jgi:hypothetical protein